MRQLAQELGNNFRRKMLASIVVSGYLVAACSGGSSGPATTPTSSALDLFDALWSDFDVSYSFFELKGTDWNDSRTRFRSQLSSTSMKSMSSPCPDPPRLRTPI